MKKGSEPHYLFVNSEDVSQILAGNGIPAEHSQHEFYKDYILDQMKGTFFTSPEEMEQSILNYVPKVTSLSFRKKRALIDYITRQQIRRLYKQEVKGIYDEELMDEIISGFLMTCHDLLDIYEGDQFAKDAFNILQDAATKSPQEKMIAIDQVLSYAHATGTYINLLVINGTEEFLENLHNLERESLNMKKVLKFGQKELDLPESQVTKQELIKLYKKEAQGIYDEEVIDAIVSEFIRVLEEPIKWNDYYLAQILRKAKTPQEKMMAIDQVINTAHYTGKYIDYLIVDGDKAFLGELSNLKIGSLNMRKKAQPETPQENFYEPGKSDEYPKGPKKPKRRFPFYNYPPDDQGNIINADPSYSNPMEYDTLPGAPPQGPGIFGNLNMRKKADEAEERGISYILEELEKKEFELTDPTDIDIFVSEIASHPPGFAFGPSIHDVNSIILENMEKFTHSFIEGWEIYFAETYGLKESFSKELAREILDEMQETLRFEREIKEKSIEQKEREFTEETMEASPYAELLRKYTADEIFDIAAGKKTDVTEEEVEQAKDVITRGIVSNRLSMRKEAQIDKQMFFDFYGVSLLSNQYLETNPYAKEYKDTVVQEIKDVYVPLITKMCYSELKKHTTLVYSWEHWKEEFNIEKVKDLSLEQLARVYNEGDWKRDYGGEMWGSIVESLIQLKNTTDTNQLITIIDHINDLEHNMGLMFHDFPKVEKWFSDALEIKAQSTPEGLIPYLSTDLQKLVTEDLQLRGQEVVAPERYIGIVEKRERAANPNTPLEELAELAKDEEFRWEVARNPSAPPETLAELAKDKDESVRQCVMDNPNTPPEIKKQLEKQLMQIYSNFNLNMKKKGKGLKEYIRENIEEQFIIPQQLKLRFGKVAQVEFNIGEEITFDTTRYLGRGKKRVGGVLKGKGVITKKEDDTYSIEIIELTEVARDLKNIFRTGITAEFTLDEIKLEKPKVEPKKEIPVEELKPKEEIPTFELEKEPSKLPFEFEEEEAPTYELVEGIEKPTEKPDEVEEEEKEEKPFWKELVEKAWESLQRPVTKPFGSKLYMKKTASVDEHEYREKEIHQGKVPTYTFKDFQEGLQGEKYILINCNICTSTLMLTAKEVKAYEYKIKDLPRGWEQEVKLASLKRAQLLPQEKDFINNFVKQFERVHDAEYIYSQLQDETFLLHLSLHLEDLGVSKTRSDPLAIEIYKQLITDYQFFTSPSFDLLDSTEKEAKTSAKKHKGPIKSILEDIAQDVWTATDLETAKNVIINKVENSKIDEDDKRTIIDNTNKSSTLLELQKYIANSILFYEGMGTKLSMRKKAEVVVEGSPPGEGSWAMYQGNVYVTYDKNKRHAVWFEELGIPSAGVEYDNIVRGYFVDDRTYIGWYGTGDYNEFYDHLGELKTALGYPEDSEVGMIDYTTQELQVLSMRKKAQLTRQLFFDFYGVSLLPDNYEIKDIIIQQVRDVYIEELTKLVYELFLYKRDVLEIDSYFYENSGVKTVKNLSLEQLYELYERIDPEFAEVVKILVQLMNTADTNQSMVLIDRINDMEHMTGSIFSHYSKTGDWIDEVLDVKTNITPQQLIPYLSKDVQKAVIEHLRLTGQQISSEESVISLSEKIELAKDPNTPLETLTELAKGKNYEVLQSVAANLNTPVEVLTDLAKKVLTGNIEFLGIMEIGEALLGNSNLPRTLRKKLKLEGFKEYPKISQNYEIAEDPSTPPETLAELAKDTYKDVRSRVAKNPSTPVETLVELSKDKHVYVRRATALNTSILPETLAELAKDEDDYVRYNVAKNPNTPPKVKKQLKQEKIIERVDKHFANNLNMRKKATVPVPLRMSLDYPHSWPQKKKKKKEEKEALKTEADLKSSILSLLLVGATIPGIADMIGVPQKQVEQTIQSYPEYFEEVEQPELAPLSEHVVTATIYHAIPEQTSADPGFTADMTRIDPDNVPTAEGERIIALSRDLLKKFTPDAPFDYGDKVLVEGAGEMDGLWVVHDTMNARFSNTIDFLVPKDITTGKWENVKINKVQQVEAGLNMRKKTYVQKVILWAVYKDQAYVKKVTSTTGEHWEWFEELGLPSAGAEYDKIARGFYDPNEEDMVWYEGTGDFNELYTHLPELIEKLGAPESILDEYKMKTASNVSVPTPSDSLHEQQGEQNSGHTYFQGKDRWISREPDQGFDIDFPSKERIKRSPWPFDDTTPTSPMMASLSMRKKAQNKLTLEELRRFYELEVKGLLTDEVVDEVISKFIYGIQDLIEEIPKIVEKGYEEKIIQDLREEISFFEKASLKSLNEKIIAVDQFVHRNHIDGTWSFMDKSTSTEEMQDMLGDVFFGEDYFTKLSMRKIAQVKAFYVTRLYELEYKMSRLEQKEELTDSENVYYLKMKNEINALLDYTFQKIYKGLKTSECPECSWDDPSTPSRMRALTRKMKKVEKASIKERIVVLQEVISSAHDIDYLWEWVITSPGEDELAKVFESDPEILAKWDEELKKLQLSSEYGKYKKEKEVEQEDILDYCRDQINKVLGQDFENWKNKVAEEWSDDYIAHDLGYAPEDILDKQEKDTNEFFDLLQLPDKEKYKKYYKEVFYKIVDENVDYWSEYQRKKRETLNGAVVRATQLVDQGYNNEEAFSIILEEFNVKEKDFANSIWIAMNSARMTLPRNLLASKLSMRKKAQVSLETLRQFYTDMETEQYNEKRLQYILDEWSKVIEKDKFKGSFRDDILGILGGPGESNYQLSMRIDQVIDVLHGIFEDFSEYRYAFVSGNEEEIDNWFDSPASRGKEASILSMRKKAVITPDMLHNFYKLELQYREEQDLIIEKRLDKLSEQIVKDLLILLNELLDIKPQGSSTQPEVEENLKLRKQELENAFDINSKMIAIDNTINTMHYDWPMIKHLKYQHEEEVEKELDFKVKEDPLERIVFNESWDNLITFLKEQGKITQEASILDYPQKHLDSAMWDLSGDLPKLKENVKGLIVERFLNYLREEGKLNNPELWCTGFYYTGSTATYRYRPTTDIDIHVKVDWEKFKKSNPDKAKDVEEMHKELLQVFWNTLNKEVLPDTQHPLTYYVLSARENVFEMGEEAYDILNDSWIVPPHKLPENLDIDEKIELLGTQANAIMERLDEELGKTKRDFIDYKILKELLDSYEGDKKDIQKLIEKKLNDVESRLKGLQEENVKIHDERQKAFHDGQEPIEEGLSQNWAPGNIIFKLIEKYRYMDVLRKIKHIIEDDKITEDEEKQLEDILEPKLSMRKNVSYMVLWAIYNGKVYTEETGVPEEHANWFYDIGLPYTGVEYDKVARGDYDPDEKLILWYDATGTFGEFFDQLPELVKQLGAPEDTIVSTDSGLKLDLKEVLLESKLSMRKKADSWEGEEEAPEGWWKEEGGDFWEYSLVPQHKIRNLYKQEVRGIYDEELLDDIISSFLFTLENFYNWLGEVYSSQKSDVKKMLTTLQQAKTPQEKMIAIDTILGMMHNAGRYADYLIEGSLDDIYSLLDELAKKANNLNMRKKAISDMEIPENWMVKDKTDKSLRRTNPPRHDKNDSIVEHNIDPRIDMASLNMRKKAKDLDGEFDFPKPQVTKQELKRLYIQNAKGIYDEEAIDAVVAGFIVTIEQLQTMSEKSIKELRDEGVGKESMKLQEQLYQAEFGRLEDMFDTLYGADTPQEKMIAIDQVINNFHEMGKYVDYLVVDGDETFLDELGNLKISSLNMRKAFYGQPTDKNYNSPSLLLREDMGPDYPSGPAQAEIPGTTDDDSWGESNKLKKNRPTKEKIFPDFQTTYKWPGGEVGQY